LVFPRGAKTRKKSKKKSEKKRNEKKRKKKKIGFYFCDFGRTKRAD